MYIFKELKDGCPYRVIMTPFCNLPPELKRHISSFLFETEDDDGYPRFVTLTDDETNTKLRTRRSSSKTQYSINAVAYPLTKKCLLGVTTALQWEKNNVLELYKADLFLDYIDCFAGVKLTYLRHYAYLNEQICELFRRYWENQEHIAVERIMENIKSYTRDEMATKSDELFKIRDHLKATKYPELLKEYNQRRQYWYGCRLESY
jgi:hypothetical protein